jgi:hypothetical protein
MKTIHRKWHGEIKALGFMLINVLSKCYLTTPDHQKWRSSMKDGSVERIKNIVRALYKVVHLYFPLSQVTSEQTEHIS